MINLNQIITANLFLDEVWCGDTHPLHLCAKVVLDGFTIWRIVFWNFIENCLLINMLQHLVTQKIFFLDQESTFLGHFEPNFSFLQRLYLFLILLIIIQLRFIIWNCNVYILLRLFLHLLYPMLQSSLVPIKLTW